ncbi:MAG: hypothetical protein E7384_08455 [Ruminococcaceae bacterium]|nr:hypothetical protein [Oscillospiraceae bacterium]
MKKFLCLLLSVVMLLSILTACGEDKKSSGEKPGEDGSEKPAVENVLTAEKMAAVVKDSFKGAMSTAELKVVIKDDNDAGSEITPDELATLKNYGWTPEKIEATVKMSLLTTEDERAKFDMKLSDGKDKEMCNLSLIVIKGDVYVETASLTGVIDLIRSFAPDAITEELAKQIKQSFGGKKYVMVNLESLLSMYGASSETADEEQDSLYPVIGMTKDELKKAIEAFSAEENIVKALEKAIADVKLITEGDDFVTINLTDESAKSLYKKIVEIISGNADFLGGQIFNAMKNSYIAEEDSKAEDYIAPEEVFTSDAKKELIDKIKNFGKADVKEDDEDSAEDVQPEEDDAEIGFEFTNTFSVVDEAAGSYKNTFTLSVFEKGPNKKDMVTVTCTETCVKSAEKVADISASDCIAFESVIMKLSNLFAGSYDEPMSESSDKSFTSDSMSEAVSF